MKGISSNERRVFLAVALKESNFIGVVSHEETDRGAKGNQIQHLALIEATIGAKFNTMSWSQGSRCTWKEAG